VAVVAASTNSKPASALGSVSESVGSGLLVLGLHAESAQPVRQRRVIGTRLTAEADATTEDFEREAIPCAASSSVRSPLSTRAGHTLRSVLRIQSQVFDGETGELSREEERYLISSVLSVRGRP
jgi:hypothetical protein